MQHHFVKHLVATFLLWLLDHHHIFAGTSYLLYKVIPVIPFLDPTTNNITFPDLIHLLILGKVLSLGKNMFASSMHSKDDAPTTYVPLDKGKLTPLSPPWPSCKKSLGASPLSVYVLHIGLLHLE
jgi:hypothetical protein